MAFASVVVLLVASSGILPIARAQTVLSTVNVGTQPYGVGYDSGKGEVFVVNYGSNSVSAISEQSNAVVSTISVGTNPADIAYDPAKGEMFVSDSGSSSVSVISDSSNSVHFRLL